MLEDLFLFISCFVTSFIEDSKISTQSEEMYETSDLNHSPKNAPAVSGLYRETSLTRPPVSSLQVSGIKDGSTVGTTEFPARAHTRTSYATDTQQTSTNEDLEPSSDLLDFEYVPIFPNSRSSHDVPSNENRNEFGFSLPLGKSNTKSSSVESTASRRPGAVGGFSLQGTGNALDSDVETDAVMSMHSKANTHYFPCEWSVSHNEAFKRQPVVQQCTDDRAIVYEESSGQHQTGVALDAGRLEAERSRQLSGLSSTISGLREDFDRTPNIDELMSENLTLREANRRQADIICSLRREMNEARSLRSSDRFDFNDGSASAADRTATRLAVLQMQVETYKEDFENERLDKERALNEKRSLLQQTQDLINELQAVRAKNAELERALDVALSRR